MDRFRAFEITQLGEQTRAGFVERTVDDLDAGEVLVRVAYSSVNYKDALAATGRGRILRRQTCIGGIDLSGTVAASTHPRFAVGDQVLATGYDLGVQHGGGYAEYARTPAAWLVPLPEGLSGWEAMAIGTAGFTAALAIVRLEQNGLAPSRGPVVVTGASGGVGSLAIDVLSRLGYQVVALTGKAAQADYLRRLGAHTVRLRTELDLAKIRPLGTGEWAGAVDNLGGDVLAWLVSTMGVGGCVASVGLAMSATLHTTVLPFLLRGVSLLGIDSVNCAAPLRERVWQRLAGEMRPGHLAEIARTIPFEALPSVFDDFTGGRMTGRVVVDLQAAEAPS